MLNKRQQRAIAAMKYGNYNLPLYQRDGYGATWFVWNPEHYHVRVNLTCRDVIDLVNRGLVTTAPHKYDKRYLVQQGEPISYGIRLEELSND